VGSNPSEEDILAAILDLCKILHLHAAHFRAGRTERGWRTPVSGDGKGFPDLVIAGPNGVIYRELKTATGRLGIHQHRWLKCLTTGGADAAVWRPDDLRSGKILTALIALSANAPPPAITTTPRDPYDAFTPYG
jgi:hypothetical protein